MTKTAFWITLSLFSAAGAAPAADLDGRRLREARDEFAAEANRAGTAVFAAVNELRDIDPGLPATIAAADVRALETDSETCADSRDSVENRTFLLSLKYAAFRRSNTDENGNYLSNTVGLATKFFVCEMAAKRYGSQSVSWSCRASGPT